MRSSGFTFRLSWKRLPGTLYRMMSLPRFRAIANHRVGHLNRLAAIYGNRIFPARPKMRKAAELVGFLTDRTDRTG